jgi:heme oxygenase (mycobilin-producing)
VIIVIAFFIWRDYPENIDTNNQPVGGGEMIRVVLEHRTKDEENTRQLVEGIKKVRAEARKQHGFIAGDTLVNVVDPCHVVVISSWQTLADWKAWDESAIRKSMLPLIEDHLIEAFTENTMTDNVVWKEEIAHVF